MKELQITIIFFFFSIIGTNITLSQTIVVQQNNHNETIKLANHYGDNIFLMREIKSNENGKSVFYFTNLNSGIYYLILPDSSSFEFMYDSVYKGKISIEEDENNLLKVASAPEITLKYSKYLNIIESISYNLDSVRVALKQQDIKTKEKRKLLEHRDRLHTKKDSLINTISQQYYGTLLGAYAKAQQKITVPDYTPPANVVNKDSAIWAWRIEYYNKHFLDNLDIADDRLISTPIYTSMINRYLDKITPQQPEYLTKAIDFILNKASSSELASRFLSEYLLNKYNKLKNAAIYEVVYLHIIEYSYLKAESKWVSNNDIEILSREFNRRKPLELGQIAPNITLSNYSGTDTSLHAINSDYIVLYFYNYDCSLCQKTGPELKKLSLKHDIDKLAIFAVCLGEEDGKSKEYIEKNGLFKWINVFDSKQVNSVASRYNLKYTPTIHLLDKDKTIISKNLTIDQLNNIVNDSIEY